MRLEIRKDETRADFIRRVVVSAAEPTAQQWADLRRLLPPVATPVETRRAA